MQDQAVTESMGPIYDRQGEHLGVHDEMVVRMRECLLSAVQRFTETGECPANDPSIDWSQIRGGYARVCSGQSSGLELMREGAEITQALAKHPRIVQVGTQQRSMPR